MISKSDQIWIYKVSFSYLLFKFIFYWINYSKEKLYYKHPMDAAIKTTQFFHLFSFIRPYQFPMREEREREREREGSPKKILF